MLRSKRSTLGLSLAKNLWAELLGIASPRFCEQRISCEVVKDLHIIRNLPSCQDREVTSHCREILPPMWFTRMIKSMITYMSTIIPATCHDIILPNNFFKTMKWCKILHLFICCLLLIVLQLLLIKKFWQKFNIHGQLIPHHYNSTWADPFLHGLVPQMLPLAEPNTDDCPQ